MKDEIREPKTPLLALLVAALLAGQVWGLVCLLSGNPESQTPSDQPEAATGQLARLRKVEE